MWVIVPEDFLLTCLLLYKQHNMIIAMHSDFRWFYKKNSRPTFRRKMCKQFQNNELFLINVWRTRLWRVNLAIISRLSLKKKHSRQEKNRRWPCLEKDSHAQVPFLKFSDTALLGVESLASSTRTLDV